MKTNQTSNTQQAAWIALGTLFSFGFGIASSIILSRYFPKADYGTYQQVLYVYGTLLTVFTIGLPKAYSYFLPRVGMSQAKALIKKINNLFFLLGAIFSLLLYALSDQIASLLNNPDLSLALKVFSPVPFLMLPTMGLEGILATYRMTKFMAIYTIATRSMMLFCVAFPVLFWGGNYIQALIGFVVASVMAFLLALYFKFYPLRGEAKKPCETKYEEILRFSLPLLYASLWGLFLSSAGQFFISRYFGQEVFAEFANGSLELPFVGMIVGATAAVLSPIFSRMSHENLDPQKEIFPIWKSVSEKSAMLTYPLLLYVWFFAEELMVFLYGEKYSASANYFRIITVFSFFSIIAYAPLVINIGKVGYYAKVHMWGALVLIPLQALSVAIIFSPYAIIAISVLCRLGIVYFMLRLAASLFDVPMHRLFPIITIAKIVVPSVIILCLIKYLLGEVGVSNGITRLLVGGTLYGPSYILLAWTLRLDYISVLKPLLEKVGR